jgi:hypothetical protein
MLALARSSSFPSSPSSSPSSSSSSSRYSYSSLLLGPRGVTVDVAAGLEGLALVLVALLLEPQDRVLHPVAVVVDDDLRPHTFRV